MEDAVYDVATAAYDQLLTARSLMSQIPHEAFPALLSAVSFFFFKGINMMKFMLTEFP